LFRVFSGDRRKGRPEDDRLAFSRCKRRGAGASSSKGVPDAFASTFEKKSRDDA